MKYEVIRKQLKFRFAAGTSRGVYHTREVWYIIIYDEKKGRHFFGEASPLPGLSIDYGVSFEEKLYEAAENYIHHENIDIERWRNYPAILMALETVDRHRKSGSICLWNNSLTKGQEGITINGLVWMGDYMTMLKRCEDKIKSGFNCIKIKIGAIDFEQELSLLRHIREAFSAKDIELRLDANGAFSPNEALQKLERLAKYDIHSIEQPIKAGQWQHLSTIIEQSPIPIALDEELIGITQLADKKKLLQTVKPQYIILKPTLHGALSGSQEWISLARQESIGFWLTSALESNVALNVIAQYAAEQNIPIAQGLGTGALFYDNAPYPITISKDKLYFEPSDDLHQSEKNIVQWIRGY